MTSSQGVTLPWSPSAVFAPQEAASTVIAARLPPPMQSCCISRLPDRSGKVEAGKERPATGWSPAESAGFSSRRHTMEDWRGVDRAGAGVVDRIKGSRLGASTMKARAPALLRSLGNVGLERFFRGHSPYSEKDSKPQIGQDVQLDGSVPFDSLIRNSGGRVPLETGIPEGALAIRVSGLIRLVKAISVCVARRS